MSGEVVRSLFVTLRRGLARKPWPHRRIIDALGLSRPHDCVEKPNNASIRGMLMKVPHLVIVETDKMYYYRRMRDYYEGLNRAPIAAQHPAPAQSLPAEVPAPTQHVQALHQAHLLPDGMEGFAQNWTRKKPTKHTQERQDRERIRALTESGLYSPTVKQINQRDIMAKAKQLIAKRRQQPGEGSE